LFRSLRDFHLQHLVRVQGREVVEENFLSGLVGRFKVYCLYFNKCEIALAFFRRPDLSANCIAGAQIKFSNLGRRNINIIRTGKVVVFRRPQKTKTVRQSFENSFRKDKTALFRLGCEHFEYQLLLTHSGRTRHIHAFGNPGQLRDGHLLEVGQVEKTFPSEVSAVPAVFIRSFSGGYTAVLWITGVVVRARSACTWSLWHINSFLNNLSLPSQPMTLAARLVLGFCRLRNGKTSRN